MAAVRVLVADDNRIIRWALRQFMATREDLELIGEAADGQEAVELCRQRQPDVVVMDYQMPRLSGSLAARQIKQQMPHTVVIGMSMDDLVARRHMEEAGADSFLEKPFSPQVLHSLLGRWPSGDAPDVAPPGS